MLVCAVVRKGKRDLTFFVDSPAKEKQVLRRLARHLSTCTQLVTFNGKSFDIPFVVSRSLIVGVVNPIVNFEIHVDLYEESKKLLRFDSNNMAHIARTLGIETQRDIAGNDVPGLYLRYLASGDNSIRASLIDHCTRDVDTLQKLFEKLRPMIFTEG